MIPTETTPRWLMLGAVALAVWGVGNMLAVVLSYQLYPGYLELNETSLVVMANSLLSGDPIYRSLESPDRVTHVHGPMTFLWTVWPLKLFGLSVFSGRLAASLAAIALPLVLVLGQWRRGGFAVLMAAAFGGLAILVHLNMTVVVRPDTPVTLMAAAVVWAAVWAERDGGWKASLALGLCAGIMVGFKINAAVFIVPVALYHVSGDWLRRIPLVAVPALAAFVLPFAHPSFSAREYTAMMAPMAGKENSWFAFTKLWGHFSIYLLVPPTLWLLAGRQALADWRIRIYLGSYLAMVVLTLFPATKPGAGHYYFMAFLAPMVDLSLRALAAGGARAARQKAVVLVAGLVYLLMGFQQETRFFKTLNWPEARQATAEINRIMADFPGKTIQMGVGGNVSGDPLTLRFYAYRFLLAAAGNPYTMDLNTVMELSWLRIPMPEEMFRRIETCHTDLWLVPHGERPFSLIGYYYEPPFPKRFQDIFLARHELAAQHDIYDVWACRK